jgi:hypothetical protein
MFCGDKVYTPDYSDIPNNGVKANSPKATPAAMQSERKKDRPHIRSVKRSERV